MSKFARPTAPDPYTLLPDAPAFTLTSEDLEDGKAMPLAHVHVRPGGENVSPQLSWSGAPEGTKSYVVTCFDPDAPTVSGFWHWIVAGVPADVTSLERDAGAEGGGNLPAGAVHLRNDFGDNAYGGAAPPEGDGPHRYMFVVHALSASAEDMEWEADDPAGYASFATTDTTLARARLTVTYER